VTEAQLVEGAGASPLPRPTALHRWVALLTADETLLVAAITVFAFAIRLYRLDDVPAEMWGDVIEHYALANQILHGQFFFDYRFGGDGAMFSYIVAALAIFLGLSFATIKLATVLIGTASVAVEYYLVREYFGSTRIAFLACFVTAVSFWNITFSRQGKPYILVALFVELAILFALRRRPIAAGITLGLGMYTQAAFWGLPFVFVFAPVALLVGGIVALPVLYSFWRNPGALVGQSSYIGSKLGAHLTLAQRIQHVLQNTWKDAISYNVRGDNTFRHNIPGHPHLDVLSGVLFVLGMGLLLWRIGRNRDRRLFVWFLLPFLLVQLPSVSDMDPLNVPAMGRMIGATPFAFAAIAYAIDRGWTAAEGWLGARVSRPLTAVSALAAVVLAAIFAINMYNYFVVYPKTLPNGNTPFGRTIARRIDRSAPGTYSFLVGCCWGDWAQPEPGAVTDVVDRPRYVLSANTLADAGQEMRSVLPAGSRVVLYADPGLKNPTLAAGLGLRREHSFVLRRNGWNVAWVIRGNLPG
jgi:hypothetical protein